MLANFIQTVYNATDAWWLGKLGADARYAVSAVGIAFPLVFFINSFGVGFVVAGTSLISRFRGAGQTDRIRAVAGQFILLLVAVLPAFLLLTQALHHTILTVMKVPADIYPFADGYTRLVMVGMGFNFIFLAFQSVMHGLGDTVTPMKILVSTVLLNLVLDPLLIFGVGPFPRMGTMGAGVATMMAGLISATAAIITLARKHRWLLPNRTLMRPNPSLLRTIFSIAVPASLAQSVTSFGFLVLIGFVSSYGAAVISVYTINNRMTNLFMMPAMGISSGLAAIVGQNLGAGKRKRAKAAFRMAMVIIMAMMGAGALMLFFFGAQFTRFFLADADVVEAGERMFKISCWASFFFGMFFVHVGVFNGSGYTMPNMVLNITRLWILRIPLTFLMSGRLAEYVTWPAVQPLLRAAAVPLHRYPYDALWWSMLISNVICAGAAAYIYARGKWQYRKI